ncbi:MAG: OmpH family outer membrane protein [Alphaproteobacteria bacterium]|jgi:Skp family chaperone for outer membrane proteins
MKLKTKYRFFAKISLLAVVLFFGAFNVKVANAQTISPNPLSTSIAVVDIKLIVEKSKAALSLAKQLQETQGKFQKEIKKVETSLKEKEEKLVKQKSIIEESAYEEKVKQFQSEVFDANQSVKKKKATLEKGYLKGLEQIRGVTLDIIADIARANKYSIVLPKSQLLYSEKANDISEQVLAKLDSKLSSVKLNLD